ncbi:helix-turn-helix transcriptional regulator [Anaerovoracaceae bacterium 42-11]
MAFLQESEWMFLNEIAYNVSFIYSFDEMRRTALKWLHMLVGFDGGVFALVEEEQIKNSISYGLDEKETEIFEKTAGEGSPLQWLQISGRSAAWVQSELLSDEAMEKSDFYQKFYLPQQFRYAMGMNIVFREEVVGMITFYRKRESGDFTKRELFIMDQLQKHLAYRLYYEAKKGDTRYFFAKGYHERISKEFGLTGRESELLDYAVKGYSNERIADLMHISVNTVKKHLHSLYEKMHVKNRVQLLQSLPLSTDKINFDEL